MTLKELLVVTTDDTNIKLAWKTVGTWTTTIKKAGELKLDLSDELGNREIEYIHPFNQRFRQRDLRELQEIPSDSERDDYDTDDFEPEIDFIIKDQNLQIITFELLLIIKLK